PQQWRGPGDNTSSLPLTVPGPARSSPSCGGYWLARACRRYALQRQGFGETTASLSLTAVAPVQSPPTDAEQQPSCGHRRFARSIPSQAVEYVPSLQNRGDGMQFQTDVPIAQAKNPPAHSMARHSYLSPLL